MVAAVISFICNYLSLLVGVSQCVNRRLSLDQIRYGNWVDRIDFRVELNVDSLKLRGNVDDYSVIRLGGCQPCQRNTEKLRIMDVDLTGWRGGEGRWSRRRTGTSGNLSDDFELWTLNWREIERETEKESSSELTDSRRWLRGQSPV